MTRVSLLTEIDGQLLLTFYTGEFSADETIVRAGHEPNGYFWEGVAKFLRPDLASRIQFDSEAGMFAAYGSLVDLSDLQTALEAVLVSPELAADILVRASAVHFAFDD